MNPIDTDTSAGDEIVGSRTEEASAEDVAEGLRLLRQKRAADAAPQKPMCALWLERNFSGGLKKLGEFTTEDAGRYALQRANEGGGTYILALGVTPPVDTSKWIARRITSGGNT